MTERNRMTVRPTYCMDIETTGVDPNNSQIVSIALQNLKDLEPSVCFANESELETIGWLREQLPDSCKIYTWRPFDVLFISQRCGIHNVENPVFGYDINYVDLHNTIAENKEDCSLQAASDLSSDTGISGSDVPKEYERYLKGSDLAKRRIIRHNKLDVIRMVKIMKRLRAKRRLSR